MTTSKMSISKALGEAMAEEMEKNKDVIIMGLDVGSYGGAFGATKGLFDEFGPERVLDMPISEEGYVGAGVGAAATGLRPIVELQFSDWVTIASDQLVNQAAKMRYMFGGQMSIPLVLRAPVGGYTQAAAQHSQMFESWFTFVPGLKVVMPATAADAKGLLKASIRDDNPVIFFEHKRMYDFVGEVPEDPDYIVPLGKADIKREGEDLTIVTYSYMVEKAMKAAEQLDKEGISVEVVDLRTISPMDKKSILSSVKKTNKVICLQETWLTSSVMAEVAAVIAEDGLFYLDAPVKRLGSKDVPTPFNKKLEQYVLPDIDDIIDAAHKLINE